MAYLKEGFRQERSETDSTKDICQVGMAKMCSVSQVPLLCYDCSSDRNIFLNVQTEKELLAKLGCRWGDLQCGFSNHILAFQKMLIFCFFAV